MDNGANMKPFNLEGHTALVTGSSRGIGKAIALALGKAGAKLYFHGVRESEAMRQTLNEASQLGINHEVIYADISHNDGVEALIKGAKNVDIAFLNASIQYYGHIEDFNDGEFEQMVDTNIRSSFKLVKAFASEMAKRNWGRIVIIGSVNQAHPAPRLAIYASTKAACRALALTAAKEYAACGVTVNTISPGVIETDRNMKVLANQEFRDKLKSQIPIGRFGTADDCTGVALLLASDAGSYITGIDITVDGGLTL